MGYDMSELEKNAYNKGRKDKIPVTSIADNIISQKNAEARGKAKYEKYGKSKGIDDGIAYRICLSNEIKANNEAEEKAFFYGVYECANMQLDTMVQFGYIPGRVKNKIAERIKKNNRKINDETIEELFKDKSYVENMINNILITTGYRDAEDEALNFDDLPESLKDNEYYLQGYNRKAKKRR